MRIALTTFALLLAIVACGTLDTVPATGPAPFSPYFKPRPGVIYAYGNFCGPQLPALRDLADRDARVARIVALKPVDDIDAACKAHDLCYERFGHDNTMCDLVLGEYVSGNNRLYPFKGSSTDSVLCGAVQIEVSSGVLFKPKYGPGDGVRGAANVVGAPVMALSAANRVTAKLFNTGYPARPGYCFFKDEYLADNLKDAVKRLDLASRKCRSDSKDPAACASLRGRTEGFTVDDLLQ